MELHDRVPEPQRTDEDVATRLGFLRRLGLTLAVGLGVALAPGRVHAGTRGLQQCCRQNCRSCSSGIAYYCYANGGCPSCCLCQSDVGHCYSSQYCIC